MNIFIVPIEPIDNRYTRQWYDNIPVLIEELAQKKGVDVTVRTIDGEDVPDATTSGAFLDFAATNFYKATQAASISRLFMKGEVNPGDKFLVTDAWNFVITPIRYMSELLDIPVEIHSIFHAGAYDPSDILGMKMSKGWSSNAERSWFYASDFNYFGTNFHKDMFLRNLGIPSVYHEKAIRSGQPHTPIIELLEPAYHTPKQKKIIWPHRYNSDKQPEIAEDLSKSYNVIVTQKLNLKKNEYYDLMGQCGVIFSCSLHENLGISIMEAVLAGVIPILPNRCSYSEMYEPEFLYPSEYTSSYANFKKYRRELDSFIKHRLNYPELYADALLKQRERLKKDYLSADVMLNNLVR